MARTTRLELATSEVTALREMVLQQLTSTRGLPNAAQVIQSDKNCEWSCGLKRRGQGPCPFPAAVNIGSRCAPRNYTTNPRSLRWPTGVRLSPLSIRMVAGYS